MCKRLFGSIILLILFLLPTSAALAQAPAPGDGVLATILSPDGAERVKAGAVIGLIAVAGEDPGALRVAEPAKAAATSSMSRPTVPVTSSAEGRSSAAGSSAPIGTPMTLP